MAIPVSELQKRNPSNIIELFQLQLSTAIHGTNTTYYFHNGASEDGYRNIIFDNQEYTRMPIESDGYEYNGRQLPRPTLRVSNIAGTITTLLLTLPQGLEGAKVTRIRTLERYLDAANFDGGDILLENSSSNLIVQEDDSLINQEEGTNPHGTPDASAIFPSEVYFISRKVTENRALVEFELAASFDLDGVRIPKRQVLPADFPGIGSFYS
jgi:phage-related protein